MNKRLGMCMRIGREGSECLKGWRGLCRRRAEGERSRRIGGEGDKFLGGLNENGMRRRVIQMPFRRAMVIGKGG